MDVFKHMDMLAELGVTKTPTFMIWVNGELESTYVGEDLDQLESNIIDAQELYQPNDEIVALSQTYSKPMGLA